MANVQIIGLSSRPKWVEQRRTILLELINDDPTNRWSARDMAYAMQNDPRVMAVQPTYSKNTALRDWLAVKGELVERRGELASHYVDTQLSITEEAMEKLLRQAEVLDEIPEDIEEYESTESFAQTMIAKITAQGKVIAGLDRMMNRQAALLPIEVPKQLNIDKREVTMTLDKYLAMQAQMKKDALAISDGEIIEGELLE